jgi:Spy/CpxP family protein refolding chaperone
MNATLKWKLVVGFVLAFLAGCATGAFFAAHHSHHLRDLAHHRHSLAYRMRNRIQAQLDLTPAQIEKIGPIFDQAASELQKIRTETGARVRQVIAETERALAPQLTPEQRKKLEKMEQESHAQHGLRNAERLRSHREPKDETDPGD